MADAPRDVYEVYLSREKGISTRLWIELVGGLHRLGYRRLRLACSWEHAGPAPVWFGVVAPGSYFRRDHGAILARHPFPEKERNAWMSGDPNRAPMFSSRLSRAWPDYPWPGFGVSSAEEAAARWIELYPQLAAEGEGEDDAYVAWYDRMLKTTAPTGLLAAYDYSEPLPGFMYVSYGPAGISQFELPLPGHAESGKPDAAS